ncbi:unnamed protein product [Enterobius vermicularis]|uniref:Uncharacterized protein n=1 Tax=Enterobius vermicularis TaxID=51028 RepID=A0A0N4V6K2_ENTVE|nr:unnamed protein product [Enterobius vermicularis]
MGQSISAAHRKRCNGCNLMTEWTFRAHKILRAMSQCTIIVPTAESKSWNCSRRDAFRVDGIFRDRL